MTRRLAILTAILALASIQSYALDTNLAFRIDAEVANAGMESLPDLTWIQGTTPLVEFRALKNGKAVALSTNVKCRMLISSNIYTGATYAQVTNAILTTNATANSMWCQWGTIGTNSAGTGTTASAWGYLAFFEDADTGTRYWNGSGNLFIEKSTATGDGLVWQTVASTITGLTVNGTAATQTNGMLYATVASTAGTDPVWTNWLTTNAVLDLAGTRAMTGPLDMGGQAITNISSIISHENYVIAFDGPCVSFGGADGIDTSGTTNVWLGRVNDTESSRIAALGTNLTRTVGGLATTGTVTAAALALGTNAAVSDWPSASGGGIDEAAAGQIATNVAKNAQAAPLAVSVVDGTATLPATDKLISIAQGTAVLTNWAFSDDDAASFRLHAIQLVRGTNTFAWPAGITNIPTASATNIYFLYRMAGAAAWSLE